MNKKEIDALDRILDYMWEDEAKHFSEMYDQVFTRMDNLVETLPKECEADNGGHIFCSLLVLERYLKKPRK